MAIEMKDQLAIEQRMRAAFEEQSATLLANVDKFRKPAGSPRLLGLEVEYPIVRQGEYRGDQVLRDRVIATHPEWLQPELGTSQIELTTDPLPVTSEGMLALLHQLKGREQLLKQAARAQSLTVYRSGTNPLLRISEIVRSNNKRKYQEVPDYYNEQRTLRDTRLGTHEPVEVNDLAVVSILNSVQPNIEARGPEDAIDLLSRGLMLSPNMVALSGNARYMEGKDTGMADVRIPAWSTSLDTRTNAERAAKMETRVGLPDRYPKDLADHLAEAGRFPFIVDEPEAAILYAIGMYWKDGRVKVVNDSLVVELRAPSAQPSPTEDLALSLAYVGRITYSQMQGEPLLPMDLVKENKVAATHHGLDAKLWHQNGRLTQVVARDMLEQDLQKAKLGLQELGMSQEILNLLSPLELRLQQGTPSDRMHEYVQEAQRYGATRREAIMHAITVLNTER